MKNFLIVILLFFLSCAKIPERPVSLSEKAPQVLSIFPLPTTLLSTEAATKPEWVLFFNHPLDPSTVRSEAILLLPQSLDIEAYGGEEAQLYKAIDRGTLSGLPLTVNLEGYGRVMILKTEEDLLPNQPYTLLVTPRVLSYDHVPLDQERRGQPSPFIVFYRTEDRTEERQAPITESKSGLPQSVPPVQQREKEEMPSPIPSTIEQIPLEPSFEPITGSMVGPTEEPRTEQSIPEEIQEDEMAVEGREVTEETEPITPTEQKIVFNEIYYDAVGSDTDGILFIELYGTPGMGIGGFRINFIDGGDGSIDDGITLPEEAKIPENGFYLIADSRSGLATESYVSDADLIDNFDPQNGPDAIQLVDSTGTLVDSVGYGEEVISLAENELPCFEGRPASDVMNGHSLERKEPGSDSNDNFEDFVDREVPSPGE